MADTIAVRTITIALDADDTTADGTVRGDEAGKILKRVGGFMWSRSRGLWVHNRTWHYSTRQLKVRAVVAALEAAGIEVTVERAELAPRVVTVEDVAAREAGESERAARRIERFEDRAERTGNASEETWNRARGMASHIPLGQPILVGHHSERRDRNFRARINRLEDKAVAMHQEAQEAARRAEGAASTEAARMTLPATLRRIDRLETERRDVQRKLDGQPQWRTHEDGRSVYEKVPASGEWRDRLTIRATELDATIAYWRQHVTELEAQGQKVWTRADFKPGDWARCGGRWMQVVKVNPKTLALETGHMPWPLKYPYSDVTGRRTAEERLQG